MPEQVAEIRSICFIHRSYLPRHSPDGTRMTQILFVCVHLKFPKIRVYPVRSVLIRVLFFALSG